MPLWKIAEIKLALENQIIKVQEADIKIDQVVINSRQKTNKGLFIALDGKNNDGHNFLNQAFENGCVASIVEKIPTGFENDQRLILVKNSLQSLNCLASFARSRTKAKIIAITGSVGKTSTKEMLKNVFTSQVNNPISCFASSGNFNNNFGLPLSLANMHQDCEFGIFEMGMSHFDEIRQLSNITKPDIAIITSISSAHIGNFKNEEEIALAKSEIFSGLTRGGFVIINADNSYIDFLTKKAINQNIPIKNIVTFGSKEFSSIRLLTIEKSTNFNSKVDVFIASSGTKISYLINSINQVTIFNSLIAVTCLELVGKDLTKGLKNLKTLQIPKGRGNLINVKKDGMEFVIIDDSYNANPASMKAGLKFLSDLKSYQSSLQNNSRTIAFIGDMLELGKFSDQEHKEIVKHISDYKIDKIILVGTLVQNLVTEISPKKLIGYFQHSSLASMQMKFQPQNGDIIFVKGSRTMEMEKIIEKLLL
jgi:UDP-N-acetylmuramoyl-tripeptide--D-alanyl-D-alanine ligase